MTRLLATVFLVDDDPAVRESLSLSLTLAGLSVQTYESGQAFLEAYNPGGPGCLVLDMRMPGMSGLEVQQVLIARQVDLPTIFISGHSDPAASQKALQAGAIDFLVKPFHSQELVQRIRTILDF